MVVVTYLKEVYCIQYEWLHVESCQVGENQALKAALTNAELLLSRKISAIRNWQVSNKKTTENFAFNAYPSHVAVYWVQTMPTNTAS